MDEPVSNLCDGFHDACDGKIQLRRDHYRITPRVYEVEP